MLDSMTSRMLREIATTLDGLDPDEIEAIVVGKGRLVFEPIESGSAKARLSSFDVHAIVEKLNLCEDRETAQRLLAEVESKDRLVAVAKVLKVHVVKHDRREDVEQKLIAFAIGGKLRTEAIQSLNLRGGGLS